MCLFNMNECVSTSTVWFHSMNSITWISVLQYLLQCVIGDLGLCHTHTTGSPLFITPLPQCFLPFPSFLSQLVMQIPRFSSLNTHTHTLTNAHGSVSTSPGVPGKGRLKMEMNSAMLQVATQICICNYPQKYTGSFLPLSSLWLLPSLSPLSPISSFFLGLCLFPFSVCVSVFPHSPPVYLT